MTVYAEKHLPQVLCGTLDSRPINALCAEGASSGPVLRECTDGSQSSDLVLRQPLNAESERPEGSWFQAGPGGCPEDVEPEIRLSVEDFRRLPLSASVASYQPSTGTGLVNMELIVFTDPAPQVLQTTVLDTPVTVRATPAQFSWDFGDGTGPLVTTDPGAPYPEFRVFHVYREPGDYLVQLTTTWSGQFQVDGQGPWYPVTGTAQTTSLAYPETVVEAKSRLVDGPLP